MADENVYPNHPPVPDGERVGFCQDCGKPLTASTIRTVGSGVFCEPCLERRLAGTQAPGSQYGAPYTNAASGYPPPPNAGGPGAPPPPPYNQNGFNSQYPPPDGVFPPLDGSTPHPWLAGFLGFIPGVGAMYNGQFGKGIAHVLIFVILILLSDNVNGIFGLLVAGWIFYMAFEAYHTAKARRMGQPLPDPFGLNNIGEQWGLKNWNPGDPLRGRGTPNPNQPAPDWVGYVPPSNFATTPPPPPSAASTAVPPVQDIPVPPPPPTPDYSQAYAENLSASIHDQAVRDASYVNTPPTYAQTYTGVPVGDISAAAVPLAPVRRFPIGAIWLIALGLIFLLGNIDSHLRLSWRWITPLLFAALSAWIFVRRMGWAGGTSYINRNQNLACSLRGPVLLMTLAVMFALQAARWLTIGQTWPIFIIAFGGMMLLERASNRFPAYAPGVPVDPTAPNSDSLSIAPNRWTPAGDTAAKGGQ